MASEEACKVLAAASILSGVAGLDVWTLSCEHAFDEGTIEQHKNEVADNVDGLLGSADPCYWELFKAYLPTAELLGEVKEVMKKINVENDDEFTEALMTWEPVLYCTEREDGYGLLPALLLAESTVVRAVQQLSALPRPLPSKVVDMVQIADKMLGHLDQMLLLFSDVKIHSSATKNAHLHLTRWSAGVRKALGTIALENIPAGLADLRDDIMALGAAQGAHHRAVMEILEKIHACMVALAHGPASSGVSGASQDVRSNTAATKRKQLVYGTPAGLNNQGQPSNPIIAANRVSSWKDELAASAASAAMSKATASRGRPPLPPTMHKENVQPAAAAGEESARWFIPIANVPDLVMPIGRTLSKAEQKRLQDKKAAKEKNKEEKKMAPPTSKQGEMAAEDPSHNKQTAAKRTAAKKSS